MTKEVDAGVPEHLVEAQDHLRIGDVGSTALKFDITYSNLILLLGEVYTTLVYSSLIRFSFSQSLRTLLFGPFF